jgi:uncharacterized protein YdaL
MFGLFKKNNDEVMGMLSMFKPMLKMKGIDIDTVIPSTARELKEIQEKAGLIITVMISVNDTGTGFDLSFYRLDEKGLHCFHSEPILSIPQALEAISSLKSKFQSLLTPTHDTEVHTHTRCITKIDSSTTTGSDDQGGTDTSSGD